MHKQQKHVKKIFELTDQFENNTLSLKGNKGLQRKCAKLHIRLFISNIKKFLHLNIFFSVEQNIYNQRNILLNQQKFG